MTCSNRKIIKIIKKHIPFNCKWKGRISESYISDLGIDSLIYIEILVSIEKYYDITFSEEYLLEFQNSKVKDLCAAVRKLIDTKE